MTPDALVSANVRTLAAANGAAIPELAREVGLSRAAFYDRLAGKTAWLYREVAALAGYFEVELARFAVDPRTRVISGSSSAWTRTPRHPHWWPHERHAGRCSTRRSVTV